LKKGRQLLRFLALIFTHSLPAFVGATASATQTRKKNAGQCLRPPPHTFWRLLKLARFGLLHFVRHLIKERPKKADFIVPSLVTGCFSRFVPTLVPAPSTSLPTATPPPVQQKTLLASTAFFASLGVFIVGINTNALRLFAHFFRRLPREVQSKKEAFGFGNLLKKSSER
jgi:hypothetical protein